MTVDAYAKELRNQGSRVLADNPGIPHEWHGDELVFPAVGADGFHVTIQPDVRGVIVFTDVGVHEHVDGSPEESVCDGLGLVRDLLSPDMRIRELRAGNHGYRWVLERRDLDGWKRESETGLLFWNYFGRQSQRVYQNTQLPGRLAGDVPSGGDAGAG